MRQERNLSFSKSPALPGRTGSCLHTRGSSVSSCGSCDRPLPSSDPRQVYGSRKRCGKKE